MEPFILKNPRVARADDEVLRDDPRWALVERVATSAAFQKSPKLREFLLYVCETTLKNHPEDVREQQIGVRVFNRRPDYNMSEDSIVRVQARELRKHLALYFETEGKDEPIVFSIPKGGYIPVFAPCRGAIHEVAGAEAEAATEPEEQTEAAAVPTSSRRSGLVLQIMLGVLLACLGGLVGTLLASRRSLAPTVAAGQKDYAIYEPMLGSMGRDGQDTLIVLSNPRLILYSSWADLPQQLADARKLIPVPPDLNRQLAPARNLSEVSAARMYISITDDTYTGIGEAACAYNVGRIMQAMNRSVRLTEGRFLNWDAAKQQHLIVLGNPAINNWTHDNVSNANFIVAAGRIRNLAPLSGEEKEYRTVEDPAGRVSIDYGMISMSTTASGSRVLTLAGPAVSGTHGTGDFFANPDKMKSVYERLKAVSPKRGFPANWDVIIRVAVRENIPVDTAFVTCRAYAR